MSKESPASSALAPIEVVRPLLPATQEQFNLGGGMVEMQMSVADVQRQVAAVKELQSKVMVKDVHYGTIPGTNKPTLLLPGAQMLGLTFRFRPAFEETRTDSTVDGFLHREFFVKCTINNARGEYMGLGMGSCSTLESKYRFRKRENIEVTEHSIPDSYFRLKDQKAKARLLAQIMEDVSSVFVAHKVTKGVWRIARVLGETELVPYANPADYYNTVLKIAKKRAFIDAILTVTAASDTFTQDVEDLHENAERLTETTGEDFRNEGTEPTTGGNIENAEQAAEAVKAATRKKADKANPPATWKENIVHLGTLAGRSLGSLSIAELEAIKTKWIDDPKRWVKATPQDKLLRIHVIQALGHYADNPDDAPNATAKVEDAPATPAEGIGKDLGWDVVQAAARLEEMIEAAKLTEAEYFARLASLNQIPDGAEWKTLDDVDQPEWIKTQEASFSQLMKLWESRNKATQATAEAQPAVKPGEATADDIPLDDNQTKPTKAKRGNRKK